uniref:Ig-like domain-containing protein n=1 Tax=Labrus bergylta TaxID=56723 RepID=A0A3Q3GDN3_9LABR
MHLQHWWTIQIYQWRGQGLTINSGRKQMPQPISVTVVKPGDTVTLACLFTKDEAGLLNWYKMKFGFMVQTVAAGSFDKVILVEQFDNSRFTITKEGYLNFLIIRNVSKEDEATYFCQAGTAYEMKVINSTLLAVNGKVCSLQFAQSVQAGGSVKLQCSLLSKSKENREQCPGEHSVYWFRAAAGEAHPAVIYTQSHRSEEEEKRSCVYNLSKTIHNSSDAGTYYCAVLTCGQILFGEGTTVKTSTCSHFFNMTHLKKIKLKKIQITAVLSFKSMWSHC